MQCLLTCPRACRPHNQLYLQLFLHRSRGGGRHHQPPAPPAGRAADRATYVFSTRTIYLALRPYLPPSLACAALPMLLLCHQIGASHARCSLTRQTEKVKEEEEEEGEKELVDQPGDGGGSLASCLPPY